MTGRSGHAGSNPRRAPDRSTSLTVTPNVTLEDR